VTFIKEGMSVGLMETVVVLVEATVSSIVRLVKWYSTFPYKIYF
jgi:hypothetical protein